MGIPTITQVPDDTINSVQLDELICNAEAYYDIAGQRLAVNRASVWRLLREGKELIVDTPLPEEGLRYILVRSTPETLPAAWQRLYDRDSVGGDLAFFLHRASNQILDTAVRLLNPLLSTALDARLTVQDISPMPPDVWDSFVVWHLSSLPENQGDPIALKTQATTVIPQDASSREVKSS